MSKGLHLAPIVPELGTNAPAESKQYSHHLVVHFDINETILVGDEAGGDTRNDCLNKMLAKSAFVQMPEKGKVSYGETSTIEPTHWWDGTPIAKNGVTLNNVPPLYIGWEWPEACCPYYRTAYKKKSKTFVEHDGSPYQSTFDKMEEILKHRGVSELPVLNNMLPAFFETLKHLSQTDQKKTIVLRTMGSDLPDIAQAVTAFAQGKHPDYPNFYNTNFLLDIESLVKGRWLRNSDGTTVYQLFRGDELVAAGDQQVLHFIHSHTICGIQDDYPFWYSNGYEPWSGKPVWKLPNVLHVLLDDNIHNLEHDSIASVRQPVPGDPETFQSLTSQDIRQEQGRHLIRVPTIAPILHPSWFLEVIDKAQEKFVRVKTEAS
eukprot:scaffold244_cov172-Amphora_coffeaeformis.AAC.58